MTLAPMSPPAHRHHGAHDRAHALLAQITHQDTLDIAEEMLEMLAHEDQLSTHNLTLAEVAALERVGVTETMLRTPASIAPALRGRLHERSLEQHTLSATEVAEHLGVSPTRVRQRAAEGSLIARRLSDGWRFPAFQFTDDGELPGWNTVARTVAPGTPLTLVHHALTRANSLLIMNDDETSIAEWLLAGGDVAPAAQAMNTLLNQTP